MEYQLTALLGGSQAMNNHKQKRVTTTCMYYSVSRDQLINDVTTKASAQAGYACTFSVLRLEFVRD